MCKPGIVLGTRATEMDKMQGNKWLPRYQRKAGRKAKALVSCSVYKCMGHVQMGHLGRSPPAGSGRHILTKWLRKYRERQQGKVRKKEQSKDTGSPAGTVSVCPVGSAMFL